MALFDQLGKYRNTGILLIRVGLGIMFIIHGLPKLQGGPEMWAKIGLSMKNLHITFFPVVWGFLAAATETFGGVLFLLGLVFRPVCILLAFTMLVAVLNHLSQGQGISGASHAIEDGIVFLGFLFIGPGKYSIDKK
ncbi:DoxX family protein [Hufsiella ginkgonis]|uniref:DoxX family membrane protein n=1 Tax=Hufsiella ginkgonis TaxID=2695274 RepID=A0A7K1XSU8_9SPHI|nr:DoxX family protein [Hufsiella ginkgonis]MXV13990.1 DoxX family membrane protein [Hufsiella ginkgonis]